MKKHIGMVLMAAAVLGLTTGSHAVEFANVQNKAESTTLSIDHSVARESYFKVVALQSRLDVNAATTKLGKFEVKNNTIDGFEVTLSTAEGGVLKPVSGLDGEVNLPYKVILSHTGEIGEGLNPPPATIEPADLSLAKTDASGTGHPILNMAGAAVSSATDAAFDLSIQMEGNADALAMAGTYADVITLTYKDI